ncbi:glycoside hydrolase family 97 protein [Polaribacter porphyrae]|uniref:Alpha-glucosidase n=1 Tax=Polaribacter porphyrae TaxID=1137780 RepID=A0A2S7WQE3_9FLAO|nr:glycoside hydrolase family 97 protein [Polaribacter porphyrae]PQJ79819.1 hypothetical protein BTO18_11815 [Polaribacter porphyrae]
MIGRNKNIFIILLVLFLVTSCTVKTIKNSYQIAFEGIEVKITSDRQKGLFYEVKKNKQSIIEKSQLGIIINNDTLGRNSKIINTKVDFENFDYTLKFISKKITYKAKTLRVKLKEKNNFIWYLLINISKDGIAYRYEVPNTGSKTINGELSSFKLPRKTKVWFFERDNSWKLKSHAGTWTSANIESLPQISSQGSIQGLTITCELPNNSYILLAEANTFNYSALRLESKKNNILSANFSEGSKGFSIRGNINSPWRCVLISETLNDLVNNTMVASLNPKPNKNLFKNSSWIKPGVSVWRWWARDTGNYEEERQMIDDAVSLNTAYTMVDSGWENWDNKWAKVKDLCKYATKNNIGVFLWKHSKEINIAEDNFKIMNLFLDSIQKVGAKGIKVDYMNAHSKNIIEFEEKLLQAAAKRKLMVNFHGCHQSSGEFITYPNEITREGIRGVELNLMKEGPVLASHNAALPFTRFVCGPADYTPLAFTSPGKTTWAHQLATTICFYSPFQCIAENTSFLLSNRKIAPALDLIRNLPTTWDETIVLPNSKIGELAIIARRKKNDWFIGILSSGKQKKLTLDIPFLDDINYELNIFYDDIGNKVEIDKILETKIHPNQANLSVVPFKYKKTNDVDKSPIIELDINGGVVLWYKYKKTKIL